MGVGNSSTVYLFGMNLTEIPKEVQQKCRDIQQLDLSRNQRIRLDNAIGCFENLRKLGLHNCELRYVPEEIGRLTKLEVLDLSGNILENGINPSIGRLRYLKNLDLSDCKIQALPDSFCDLHELEELDLSYNYLYNGINPSIGRLHHLKNLDLRHCDLHYLPDSFCDLQELEVLRLSWNKFRNGINPSIGRLRHLKNLSLDGCELPCLPDSFGDLKELEVLDLSFNSFRNGINPSVGRLHRLKNLSLNGCELPCLPDSFGDLKELTRLNLQRNCTTKYPSCILNLKNLKTLDLSQGQRQNGISSLPMELADTNLSKLKLDGNPITEPPEAIWRQGLDAIKSYFREKRFGAGELCPDTINMIGDVFAGKTSIAQSLVQGSPRPAAEDDRTRVMQQLRATFGENGKLLVNINDFGGHQIYHCVIPIFLPTDGLTILAYNMSLPIKDQKDAVSRWLLTAIAKLKNIRVIVAGTRCDQISQDKLKDMESDMVKFVESLLNEVKSEIRRHVYRLKSRPSNSDEKKKTHLQDLQLRLNNADISVVSLSCSEPNPGLNDLRDKVSKKLRQGDSMPLRWFRFMKRILHASSNRPYLTWGEVQKLYHEEVTDEDGDKDLVVILRYLVSTSQVFWLERHEKLKEFIFHSPQSILKICKDVLSHDFSWQRASQMGDVTDRDRERYLKGMIREPFMIELISDKEITPVVIEFLKNFNLISERAEHDGIITYVLPSNLPAEAPPLMSYLEQRLHSCPNSVVIKLIFHGSVLPLSFFETSLSLMLTIATRLYKDRMNTEEWHHGLIILYEGLCFTAKRRDNVLTLAATSDLSTLNPWEILLPIIKGIHESITASWHGATPESSLLCPACRISRRPERDAGENDITLETLVTEVQHKGAKWMCIKCAETIPSCLFFPLKRESLTAYEQDELKNFFEKHSMDVSSGVYRSSKTTKKRFLEDTTGMSDSVGSCRSKVRKIDSFSKDSAELLNRLRTASKYIAKHLTDAEVTSISSNLYSKDPPCISAMEYEDVKGETGAIRKATKLLEILEKKSADVICIFEQILRDEHRPDLANCLRFGKPDVQ